MDWIQILFVAAGVIAYWLNQRAREKAGEEADYDGDGIPERRAAQQRELAPTSRDGTDPEQAERVRRIQEEIRRKIAERRGEAAPPPPMPVPGPVVVMEREPVFRETPRQPATPPPLRPDAFAHDDSASLERQRKLVEEMERLDRQRRETRRLADTTFATQRQTAAAMAAAPRAVGGMPSLAAELRNPRALRRAMVLREVLDKPVALR
jgi:hypothetical protein